MRRSSGWVRKWVWVRMGVRGSQGRGGGRGGGSQHDWGEKRRGTRFGKRVSRRSDYWGEKSRMMDLI